MQLKKNELGRTGLEVTELCFGALPMGPLQKNLGLDEGAGLVTHALEAGINFIDTAQLYGTYDPIREAIRSTGTRPVIASKSAAATYGEMERAVQEALSALGVDWIDIFLLHAARAGLEVFSERAEALRCLHDLKLAGAIRAVGISTHDAEVTSAAAEREDIEVVFPIINRLGRGIQHGDAAVITRAIGRCYEAGKGVYLMKVLAGGTDLVDFEENLSFARREVRSHSIAIGMVSREEVDYNVKFFTGDTDPGPAPARAKKTAVVVAGLCKGCGTCLPSCHSGAMAMAGGKARIDAEKCIRCGYCTAACPQFAIRVV